MNILDMIKEHAKPLIAVPAILNGGNFLIMLLQSVSDGVITDQELHNLMQASSGLNIVILGIVMLIMKRNDQ